MKAMRAMEIFSLVCLVLLLYKGALALQRFEKQPQYTEVNPGQDALLTCKVHNKRGSCSWQKDNKPVGIYPKKYEWNGGDNAGARSASGAAGGDCSLWVRAATLEFDDGHWECQVTASDFTTQDALTSNPVRLVVRVAPQRPRIEHNASHILPGHNISATAGERATVKCVSHYGNPPATLKWFLGQQELLPARPQTNATELDNPRTWAATSILEVPAERRSHGLPLRCVALHESYPTRSQDVEARLDVRYAPEIRLVGVPQTELEDNRDTVVMRCIADANPPANIVWTKTGLTGIVSLEESLQLRPVGRRDKGTYTCQAQNSIGSSEALSVELDVKFPPSINTVGPDKLTTAPLFSPAAFECAADGNPKPTYQWLQRVSTATAGDTVVERGREPRLVINNVTYDYQGEYVCKVTNTIRGTERVMQSEPIVMQVVGAPQVLRHASAPSHEVWVRRGESAALSLVVCADPRPRKVGWEWGSLRLEEGAGIGRYRVDKTDQDSREDCYLSTLHIKDADVVDAKPYYLIVENERGADKYAIRLVVDEPLSMSVLLGVAGGCLAGLILLVCLCVWVVRAEKCCFRRRGDFKPSDLDSEKPDINDKARLDGSGNLPLSADAIYTTPAGYGSRNTGSHHYSGGNATLSGHGGHLMSGQGQSPDAMKTIPPKNTFRDSTKTKISKTQQLQQPVSDDNVDHFYAALMSSSSKRSLNKKSPSSVTSDESAGTVLYYDNNQSKYYISQPKTEDVFYKRNEEFDCLGLPEHPETTQKKSKIENVINAFESLSRDRSYVNNDSGSFSGGTGSQKNITTLAPRADKLRHSGHKQRPKPLQAYESDRYFEHVFPAKSKSHYSSFQPNSIDRAEL